MNEDNIGILFMIAWLVSAVVGALIGLFFGPIGWILMALDAGIISITLTLAALVGLCIAGMISSERDKDQLALLAQAERAELARIEQDRLSGRTLAQVSSAPTVEIAAEPVAPEPLPVSTLASQSSIFPPGIDTPEQRRAYLQQLAEAKRQAQQRPTPVQRYRDRGY